MEKISSIYTDIAKRTNGDVYIGVVGPVRCGKSTFIQKFMQNFVMDNITNKQDKLRANDELPQAGDGAMVMTTKPQFVPNEAVKIKIGSTVMSVRLIDSVGFMVEGALGGEENEKPRLVKTPWSETEIPFAQAAIIGTEKVINDHSTIAIALTTDGSFGDIPRKNFIEAERRTISQLAETKKPFVVILNTTKPEEESTKLTVQQMSKEYSAPVIAINVNELKKEDVDNIMTEILKEFPLEVVNIKMPKWLKPLSADNETIKEILNSVTEAIGENEHIGDYDTSKVLFENSNCFEPILNTNIEMGKGSITYEIVPKEGLFYSELHCIKDGEETIIDARTSDAVALALRFDAPIYANSQVVEEAGIIMDDIDLDDEGDDADTDTDTNFDTDTDFERYDIKELEHLLQKAIEDEDYAKASVLRDIINDKKQRQ